MQDPIGEKTVAPADALLPLRETGPSALAAQPKNSETPSLASGTVAATVLDGHYLKQPAKVRATPRWILAALLLAAALSLTAYWLWHRPAEVIVVRPALTAVTETIASSGLVTGVQETVVGASFNGEVLRLLVKLGDHVKSGESLAVLKNDVTQAQVGQAEAAVRTAIAQLRVVSRSPQPSEIQAAQMQVTQARSLTEQHTAEVTLTRKTQVRKQSLFSSGDVAQNDLDSANAAVANAEAKQRSGVASIRLAEAQLRTLRGTPREEDIQLANFRVKESQQALSVVRQQAGEATVTAPYAGVITAVNVEIGQNVDARGLFALVSDELEIVVALDESNLADLALGQKALLSAAAFPGKPVEAELREIAPGVDRIRGTVTIKLRPLQKPAWLKPGQTLNANLITGLAVSRLLVPSTALRRAGDKTIVLVVEADRAVEKIVVTRPPTEKGVPVLAGLDGNDLVIVNPSQVQPGDAIRVKH